MKCGEEKHIDGAPAGCGCDLVPESPHMFVCAMYRCADCGIAFCIACIKKHFAKSKTKWEINVKEVAPGLWNCTLVVGHTQFFVLAAIDDSALGADPGYAKHHCEFMKEMFIKALARLGVEPRP